MILVIKLCNECEGKENHFFFFLFWFVNSSKLLGWEANVYGTWKFLMQGSHLLTAFKSTGLISSWERWQKGNKNQRMDPGSTIDLQSNRENWIGWLRDGNKARRIISTVRGSGQWGRGEREKWLPCPKLHICPFCIAHSNGESTVLHVSWSSETWLLKAGASVIITVLQGPEDWQRNVSSKLTEFSTCLLGQWDAAEECLELESARILHMWLQDKVLPMREIRPSSCLPDLPGTLWSLAFPTQGPRWERTKL